MKHKATTLEFPASWSDADLPESNFDEDHPIYGSFLNDSGITPTGHKVLLEIPTPADIKRAQESGIEIPETALERHTQAAVVALVLQLGPGCYRGKDKDFPGGPWCKPGDFVCMSAYNGTRIKSPKTGKDYRFVFDDTIDGKVSDPSYVERG